LPTWLQTRPDTADRLLTTLNRHLGINVDTFVMDLQATAGDATLYAVPFTGATEAELLLNLPAAIVTPGPSPASQPVPITLIVNAQGALLYSNLWTGGNTTLLGWLRPPAGAAALVTRQGDRIALLTWSPEQQRFD
jgi:hypothetical protein